MAGYYYCPDTGKYVKKDGFYYSIEKDGSEKLNRYYDAVVIGEVYLESISKEEYESHLKK